MQINQAFSSRDILLPIMHEAIAQIMDKRKLGLVEKQLLTRFLGVLESLDFDQACQVLLEKSNEIRFQLIDQMIPETELEAEYLQLVRREREIVLGSQTHRIAS